MKKYLLTVLLCVFLFAACGVSAVVAFVENEVGLTIHSDPACATVYKKATGAKDVGLVAISGTEGAQVFLDNSYAGVIADGGLNLDNVKLGLHYVQVKAEGNQEYATLIEVMPKNFATASVVADLVPVSSGTGVPTTAGTSGVPPAPTKSPICAVLPVIALFVAGAVLRR